MKLKLTISSIKVEPVFKILTEKKYIGKRLRMSFSENRTFELWQSFMPERKKIKNPAGLFLYSIEIYEPFYFVDFNPSKEFEKWAAMSVEDFDNVPHGMETLTVQGGMYAVFLHKGLAEHGPETYRHIFSVWLPGSDYLLDNRPHFAVMGEKYKNNDPDSEEEIWIPIKNISREPLIT